MSGWPAHGTGKAVIYEQKKEILFYDRTRGQMKLMNWEGEPWIFWKHPDGQWVSIRKATEQDISTICKNIRG